MNDSKELLWTSAQSHLRNILSPDIYSLWFAPLRLESVDGDHAVVKLASGVSVQATLPENGDVAAGRRALEAGLAINPNLPEAAEAKKILGSN